MSEQPQLIEVSEEFKITVRRSPDVGELVKALIAAQQEFKPIVRTNENEAYKRNGKASRYADLATVIDATQPALNKNGMTIIQHVQGHHLTKETIVTTTLIHISGQFIESDLSVPSVSQQGRFDPQTVFSASTYARRCAWQGITGMAPEDDDGNAASGVGSKEAAQSVAKEKIAELEAKKNGHAAPPANIPKDDLIPQLQASLDAQNAKKNGAINFPPVPEAEPPKPRAGDANEEIDDVVGEITEVKDKMTTQKRPYKSVTVVDIFGEVLELSAFDNFKLSDGTLFQYLVAGAIGQQATFTYVSKPAKTGNKVYHNIINVSRIGSHRWDEGVGVLEQADR